MPDQKELNKVINTYVNFQSRANRYDEKVLIPSEPKRQLPIDFPTGIVVEPPGNISANYFWIHNDI